MKMSKMQLVLKRQYDDFRTELICKADVSSAAVIFVVTTDRTSTTRLSEPTAPLDSLASLSSSSDHGYSS